MEAKRTNWTQRQTATNLKQANNTTVEMTQNSIPHKENREVTYAQVVAKPNKEHNAQENEEVKQTLKLILDK